MKWWKGCEKGKKKKNFCTHLEWNSLLGAILSEVLDVERYQSLVEEAQADDDALVVTQKAQIAVIKQHVVDDLNASEMLLNIFLDDFHNVFARWFVSDSSWLDREVEQDAVGCHCR